LRIGNRKEFIMRKFVLFLYALAVASLVSIGCSDDPSSPDAGKNGNNAPARSTEADVVATDNGYTVKGNLHVDTEEGTRSFINADLNVEFDEDGYLKNVSGKAEIPPPSDNVEFEDP
jgi:hypothetical protein